MFKFILRADKVVHVIVALITGSRSVPYHTNRDIFELRPGISMHSLRETFPLQHDSMMLKFYLQKAYEEVGLASDAEGTTIKDLAAALKSNAENLILVYSGAFNPPHQGHVEVIRSGLRLDLAAVAIVILPSDDQYAKDKVVGKHPYFFLNQRRRADIWQASASFPKTQVWVWRNTKPLFYSFAESLLRLTKTNRYKLEFGRLDGPDNLNMQNPFAYVYRNGFRRMVVTNKARHLQSHFGPDNKPLRWNGCGDWSIRQGSPDDDSLLLEKEDHRVVAILWTCTSVNEPSKKGFYLQYIRPVPNDINSTDLRQALLQNHNYDEDSLNALSTGALVKLLGM